MFWLILLPNRGSVDSLRPFIRAWEFATDILDQRLREKVAFLANPNFPISSGCSMFWSILSSNKGYVDSLRSFLLAWESATGILDQRSREEVAFLADPKFPLFLGCSIFWSILSFNGSSLDSLRPSISARDSEQDWKQPQNVLKKYKIYSIIIIAPRLGLIQFVHINLRTYVILTLKNSCRYTSVFTM